MILLLRSIRFRLTFWFVNILAVAILLISLAVYLGLRQALISNVDQTLRLANEGLTSREIAEQLAHIAAQEVVTAEAATE